MSVTIAQVLQLPSMRRAKVIGGQGGLSQTVTSVSVLEYAQPTPLLEELFHTIEFRGSELVITGFTGIKDDVEAQLNAIHMSHMVGEVGMILYYVGIFLPRVDQRLIDLADQLDFALILMPENDKTLRYSEVITEVVEAIQRDRASDDYFLPDVLEQIARLSPQRRSMDALLRLLSDRTHATLLLTDAYWNTLNLASWPSAQPDASGEIIARYRAAGEGAGIRRAAIQGDRGPGMNLLVQEPQEGLSQETARQCVETVRLFVNIWSERHGEAGIPELIRAILGDEPVKMRRLARLFGIDVSAIHTMWVLRPAPEAEGIQQRLAELAREVVRPQCRTVLAGPYEQDVILFLEDERLGQNAPLLVRSLLEALDRAQLKAQLFLNHFSLTTADARSAYLTFCRHGETAARLWPGRQALTLEQARFAGQISGILAQGEGQTGACLGVLAPIREDGELLRTLEVYLLDADMEVSRTAQLMYLHKNTIKYRLARLTEKLGCPPGRMPEAAALYQAAALRRLLGQ